MQFVDNHFSVLENSALPLFALFPVSKGIPCRSQLNLVGLLVLDPAPDDGKAYLLYINKSGVHIRLGSIRTLSTLPYSERFQARL